MTTDTRFEFGQNWLRFLSVLNEERIQKGEDSLKTMLGVESLVGKTFLDVGSGSGLFSLAAMRLGASRVHSFDYDLDSVACTNELKRRYYPDAAHWTIERGSVLDTDYLQGLGENDIVYSWGVLHHTGSMWQALANVTALVRSGGLLFISIYNDQGWVSRLWKRIKWFYNQGPVQRAMALAIYIPVYILGAFFNDLLRFRNPLRRYRQQERGMSIYYDWVDWLGGYPFEVATPQQIIDFYQRRGFQVRRSVTVGNHSTCNEFVLCKTTQ